MSRLSPDALKVRSGWSLLLAIGALLSSAAMAQAAPGFQERVFRAAMEIVLAGDTATAAIHLPLEFGPEPSESSDSQPFTAPGRSAVFVGLPGARAPPFVG